LNYGFKNIFLYNIKMSFVLLTVGIVSVMFVIGCGITYCFMRYVENQTIDEREDAYDLYGSI